MAAAFPDVKPFPAAGAPLAAMGHNKPPLDDVILAEFMDDLAAAKLPPKVDQLESRANAAGPCLTQEDAGRYGDGAKIIATAIKAIEAARETHNRPLLNAQRALKGRADGFIDRLRKADGVLRGHVNVFMAEERRKAAEAQRLADEQARVAREAAEAERQRQIDAAAAAGASEPEPAPPPVVEVEAPKVAAPTALGDYGARGRFHDPVEARDRQRSPGARPLPQAPQGGRGAGEGDRRGGARRRARHQGRPDLGRADDGDPLMGEIADAMLDGTLCEGCGSYIDGDSASGFPRYCSPQCAADRGALTSDDRHEPRVPRFSPYRIKGNPKMQSAGDPLRQGDKMACPFCVRKVKVTGFGDHMLTQHRDKWPQG